jgi:predicted deacylase
LSKNSPITICETTVAAGARASINLPIADLYTGTSLSMPVKVVNGKQPGPVLFVCAAIHGDELNGVEVIRRLLKLKSLRSLKGTLLAVPVVNIHGFLDQSRYLPDRRDLNRSFPGSPRGSIAARTADTFVKHVVAINRSNLPQIRANLADPNTAKLAKLFGAPVVIDSTIRDGSLRACGVERGVPILVYEAGEALRFHEVSIRAGLRGVLNTMRHLGMLPPPRKTKAIVPVIADSTSWVRAPESGIVSRKVKLGARVVEGQRLASISDPLGEGEEEVIAPFDGIVIGRSTLPLAHEGDALFHVGAFKSVSHAENKVEEFHARHTG